MLITPQQTSLIKRERRFKLFAFLIVILMCLAILLAVPGMLVSFLLAFVITYLFKPLVAGLERFGIERTLAILIVYAIVGGAIVFGSTIGIQRLTDQMETLEKEFPAYLEGFNKLVKQKEEKLNLSMRSFYHLDISGRATDWIKNNAQTIVAAIPNIVSSLLSTLILAPFYAFFMLRDGRQISHRLLGLAPNNLFEFMLNLNYQINQQLGGFIRARLLESLLVGGVVWLGLFVMGFPYALIFGLFAGITNLIPYIGPVIGAAPAIILSVLNGNSAATTAVVGIIFLAAQLVDMLVIIPTVVAKIVDMHPVTVVIVIIIGSQVMGILGMIISVPVASILKLTSTEIYRHLTGVRS